MTTSRKPCQTLQLCTLQWLRVSVLQNKAGRAKVHSRKKLEDIANFFLQARQLRRHGRRHSCSFLCKFNPTSNPSPWKLPVLTSPPLSSQSATAMQANRNLSSNKRNPKLVLNIFWASAPRATSVREGAQELILMARALSLHLLVPSALIPTVLQCQQIQMSQTMNSRPAGKFHIAFFLTGTIEELRLCRIGTVRSRPAN